MEFAILSPVAGLERYSRLSKTHLLLPQLRNLPGYAAFYRSRREEGDFVILDNGAYEGEPSTTDITFQCINKFNPQVAVLPDYLLQHWSKTWRAASMFLDGYYYATEGVKWMYVPQAEPGDIVGFIEGLFRALDDERITWIGLPRALTYAITNDLYMRVRVAEQIRKRSNVKIHALGMAKGSLEELNQLNKIACVSSIDSNTPVWRGWCGWDLYQHGMSSHVGRWYETPINYSAPLKDVEENVAGSFVFTNGVSNPLTKHELILNNLEACGVNIDSLRPRATAQRETPPSGEDR